MKMKTSTQRLLAVAGGVGLAVVVLFRAHASSPALVGPAPLVAAAGPVARTIPPGAFVAEDEASLKRALAEGPDEIWLRGRTYEGDFHVTRRLTLRGEQGATLRGTGTNSVLLVDADDVVVENVRVLHSGSRHTAEDAGIKVHGARARIAEVEVEDSLFGVSIGPCPHCTLEHVRVKGPGAAEELRGDGIKLWEAHDSVVRGCEMDGSRDLVVWYSKRVELDHNVVKNSRYGSHLMYAHDAWIHDSDIRSNVVGIFVMYSERVRVEDNVLAGARGPAGVGIGFKESDGVKIDRNWIVANTVGTYLDRTPRAPSMPVKFDGNVIALNDVALRFHSSEEGVNFTGNDLRENVTVAEVEGGGDALGIHFEGNHWSDYAGYDLDGDGRGDVAFEVKQLSSELTDARPSLMYFRGTAAMSLVDTIAQAAPVLATHRMLIDPSPAMNGREGSSK